MGPISSFIDAQFKHFNARELRDCGRAWRNLLDGGGEMFITLAGAMSSAELGISLSKLIRAGRVHAICATAANLEEDIFNLFAHDDYEMVPHYRDLSPTDEFELAQRGLNRVTDTCIPETVMRHTEGSYSIYGRRRTMREHRSFPGSMSTTCSIAQVSSSFYQIEPKNSWVLAAKDAGLPIFTPGWEDSTLGNMFCSHVMRGDIDDHGVVRTGTEQMQLLADWYVDRCDRSVPIGFFQIGGGIAGDFPICVVPMLRQDVGKEVPFWAFFAQISDSTTSYGSYSGAVPNEKITWHKLSADAPKFMINSDATIVAPLIFAYVLGE